MASMQSRRVRARRIAWRGTYSVEGDNADLRHYLARLGRKSRCFSRRLEALARQVRLFVFCYNARQLFVRKHPKLKAHLIDFLPALI